MIWNESRYVVNQGGGFKPDWLWFWRDSVWSILSGHSVWGIMAPNHIYTAIKHVSVSHVFLSCSRFTSGVRHFQRGFAIPKGVHQSIFLFVRVTFINISRMGVRELRTTIPTPLQAIAAHERPESKRQSTEMIIM